MSVSARAPSFLSLLVLLGLLGMFAASLLSFVDFRKLVTPELAEAPTAPAPREDSQPQMSREQTDSMSALMRRLQSNPNDADALLEISEIFVQIEDWPRAEAFLTRLILSRPADARPRHLLAILQYRQQRMAEAAKTFKELLDIKEDPAAMYNLAVIYKYHLDKRDLATELLEKILASPDADADTRQKAQKELDG
jgi:cytochrome c-type biogenesis protein CcmH/NrfG